MISKNRQWEYAPLLNSVRPRVLKLAKGRGRRDLDRYATFAEAHAALLREAAENMVEAKRMLAMAKAVRGYSPN